MNFKVRIKAVICIWLLTHLRCEYVTNYDTILCSRFIGLTVAIRRVEETSRIRSISIAKTTNSNNCDRWTSRGGERDRWQSVIYISCLMTTFLFIYWVLNYFTTHFTMQIKISQFTMQIKISHFTMQIKISDMLIIFLSLND